MIDYYKILNVPQDASEDLIRKAFRKSGSAAMRSIFAHSLRAYRPGLQNATPCGVALMVLLCGRKRVMVSFYVEERVVRPVLVHSVTEWPDACS